VSAVRRGEGLPAEPRGEDDVGPAVRGRTLRGSGTADARAGARVGSNRRHPLGTLRRMSLAEPQPYSSPLKRREFRLYFIGNAVSNVGNWVSNVVLSVFMLELTGSSFWVGLTGLGLFVPTILFSLPAGALADRVDRLGLLKRVQLAMFLLAVVLTVLSATDTADRYNVLALSFGLGIGVAIAIPTIQALIPLMVPHEQLGDAIRLNGLTFNLARALGPVLAAAALVTIGATWAFGFNALTFLALVGALTLIGRPPFPRPSTGPPGPIREGIRYAWDHLRTRWMLLSIVAIGITLDPITTLSPALARDYEGVATGAAGWIVAGWGGGAALMIIIGRRVIQHVTEHGLGWIGLLVLAGGIAGLGAAPSLPWAIVATLIAGAGYISATMAFTTTIQSDVPESLRGRVSALWTLAFLGPRAVAAVIDGALADAIGPRPTTVIFASVALAAAVFLRRVETPKGEPIPPPA